MSGRRYDEENFEDHVTRRLLESGYRLCAPLNREKNAPLVTEGVPVEEVLLEGHRYDCDLALIPDEVISFIRTTQPDEYDRLSAQYGEETDRNIVTRISREIGKRGALDVLRKGVKDRGVKLRLVSFRPSSSLNPEHARLYRENRFAVIRQLQYSHDHTKELDLAIFVNGLPIFTAELKNSLTGQFVANAVKQYRKDRHPKELLFNFRRCLAHFAVGNEEVFYTTKLDGEKTFFLPFNRGTADGGAGNPPNPEGHQTSYLWDDVWSRDTLLELLANYVHVQTTTSREYDRVKDRVVEKERTTLIFPRYHQLDVVRKLLAVSALEGPGHSYLVQHSAGSGKSNSIAWLAHGLRQIHREDGARLFDTIVVVTDRRVLDQQLQTTIRQFEQTAGTVVPITQSSAQLREALEAGKDIVVTTLQKFPVISETMEKLGGQNFAVIIDEAHSSQSGESAKHLKQTLSAGLEEAEREDDVEDEFDLEDEVAREIASRGRQDHISFYAFTATPKNKTLEIFGRKGADGTPEPFHTYTMRQAIEEGFILDVLRNYTTFKRYFRLVTAVEQDDEYDRQKAVRALTRWVDLTDHAIDRKARICLEHFQNVTAKAIGGNGRAMFVTRSRLHAVRYFLKFRALAVEMNLPWRPLVAFSGTVKDPNTGSEQTENSLNGLPRNTDIKDAFKLPEYRLLVVANKFQTGFDEPLLHTMYVDKKLGGVAAVQTLSRLNRTTRRKDDTVVLDFVNDAEEIEKAFQRYYQGISLEAETDPNKLYDLTTNLEGFDLYTDEDVDDFAEIFFDRRKPGELLQPILDRVVAAWKLRAEEEREDFRKTLQSFVRLYGYISQLITFADHDLEKEYVFARNLNRKLPPRTDGGLPFGVTDAVDLDSFRLQQTFEGSIDLEASDATVKGIPTEEGGMVSGPEMEYLSSIIAALNETHAVDLTDKDRVRVNEIDRDVMANANLNAVLTGNNSISSKRNKLRQVLDEMIRLEAKNSVDLYKKLSDPRVREVWERRLWERLVG